INLASLVRKSDQRFIADNLQVTANPPQYTRCDLLPYPSLAAGRKHEHSGCNSLVVRQNTGFVAGPPAPTTMSAGFVDRWSIREIDQHRRVLEIEPTAQEAPRIGPSNITLEHLIQVLKCHQVRIDANARTAIALQRFYRRGLRLSRECCHRIRSDQDQQPTLPRVSSQPVSQPRHVIAGNGPEASHGGKMFSTHGEKVVADRLNAPNNTQLSHVPVLRKRYSRKRDHQLPAAPTNQAGMYGAAIRVQRDSGHQATLVSHRLRHQLMKEGVIDALKRPIDEDEHVTWHLAQAADRNLGRGPGRIACFGSSSKWTPTR